VLKRAINADTGKTMTVLGVDEIRKLCSFFGSRPRWRLRIAIMNADDMNDAAANALLKILEEPLRGNPACARARPARLLPTIRSRCRRLDLKPLTDAEVAAELAHRLPQLPESERAAVVKLAGNNRRRA